MSIQPFTINIPQATLDDLHERLARTRWPNEVEGAGWDYGANLGYMKELVNYWQHQYDWRQHETTLNTFAHFKTEVGRRCRAAAISLRWRSLRCMPKIFRTS